MSKALDDLVGLREASLGLLREEEAVAGEDGELRVLSRLHHGLDPERPLDRGRETRGPAVVAASDGAVTDADGRRQIVLNCSNGWRQLSQ